MITTIDKWQFVYVHRVSYQLETNEAQDECNSVFEVLEFVEQSTQQEVKLAQTHQGEDVRREHEERLLGEAVDRGDRVEREQQVRRSDRDHDEQERRATEDVDVDRAEDPERRQPLVEPGDLVELLAQPVGRQAVGDGQPGRVVGAGWGFWSSRWRRR